MTLTAAVPESDLHRAARKRLAAKAGAWRFAALWVVLALLFNAVWLATGQTGGYWPVWPMLGVGIGVAFSLWGAYSPSTTPTESAIAAEMDRMQRGR